MSSSLMNPLASDFNPKLQSRVPDIVPLPRPEGGRLYELRKTHDRGFGLFATDFIPLGSLIISDEPILKIPHNTLTEVWGPYHRLSADLKATFDKLYSTRNQFHGIEEASRFHLTSHPRRLSDVDDFDGEVADHIRIMRIFAANSFKISTGELAVYPVISRLNHSCVPNVHQAYNTFLRTITAFAIRDIHPNEELTITYLGTRGTYQTMEQRAADLDFRCGCPACSDITGRSDGRRKFMDNLLRGLEQYHQGAFTSLRFVPPTPAAALKQAEDHISCLMEEGISTPDLCKAFRMASDAALKLGDVDRALEYANDEATVERNCVGSQVPLMRESGSTTQDWIAHIHNVMQESRGEEAQRAASVQRDQSRHIRSP